jgi:hypothetical protein
MAQSVTGIANRALQLVGATSVLNLTDNSPEAREVSRAYDFCRRAELRAHKWNFALARAQLAPDTAAPVFGYQYQYTLPSDCLRVILPNDATLDWKVEGKKLLTNSATSPFGAGAFGASTSPSAALYLQYVADVEDTTYFDALFCEALACRIAIAIVERLTQSNQKKQALSNDYREAIMMARQSNAFENLPDVAADDDYWLARVR